MTPKEEAEAMVRYMAEWVYSLNRPPTLVEWLYDMAPQIERSIAEERSAIDIPARREHTPHECDYWEGYADASNGKNLVNDNLQLKRERDEARANAVERERDEWKKAATKDVKMLHAAQGRIAELEAALRRAKDALVTEGACDDGDTIPWIDAALSPATAQPAPTAKPCPDCGGYGSMGHAASSSPAATNGSVTAEPSGNCKRCGEELAATVRGNHNTTQVTLACPKGCGMLAFVDTTKLSATPVEAVNSSNRSTEAGGLHHVTDAFIGDTFGHCILECRCGFQAKADDWQDAGEELDRHLGVE